MHLQWMQTVMEASDGMSKVTALAFSPNNVKLAVVTVDRVGTPFHCGCGQEQGVPGDGKLTVLPTGDYTL